MGDKLQTCCVQLTASNNTAGGPIPRYTRVRRPALWKGDKWQSNCLFDKLRRLKDFLVIISAPYQL